MHTYTSVTIKGHGKAIPINDNPSGDHLQSIFFCLFTFEIKNIYVTEQNHKFMT